VLGGVLAKFTEFFASALQLPEIKGFPQELEISGTHPTRRSAASG
jgi:hypothetical protein